MIESSDSVTVERRSPEAAFTLLGNGTRVAILRTLSEADGPLSFSELRERVGTRDSGQFNYHLRKLTDRFVRHGEGGYEPTLAGQQVVGALLAGTYTASASIDPIDVGAACPECGSDLVVEYEDEHVVVRCRENEDLYSRFTFPPGTLDQFEREELPAAFDRWLRTTFGRIVSGFCSNCSGRTSAHLERDDDRSEGVYAAYRCDRCGSEASASAAIQLLYHPAAIAFHYDHGLDVTTTPMWEVGAQTDRAVAIVEEDPLRVRVTLTAADERLVATLDEDATVVAVEREPVG